MSKTIVITGATSGLGRGSANKIAKEGYNIILVARNKEKGNAFVSELEKKYSNQKFWFYQADFSTTKATKETAQKILSDFDSVDVILNNAGGVNSSFQLNEEGFEQTIATNHLAYFAFTLTLLPILNKETGRIVNVSSRSHYKSTIDFESFTKDKGYFIMKAYGQSKLANVMFTYSLVDKLKHTNIKVNCLNPGKVKTNIGGKAKHWFHQFGWWLVSRANGLSLDEGIRTHVFLAIDEKAKDINGKYFNNMVLEKTNKESYNKEIQEKLWKWSEDATGLKWEDITI